MAAMASDVKGAMYSPAYGLMRPLSAGTEPGILDSARKPKMPIIARRPLLISTSRPRSCVGSRK